MLKILKTRGAGKTTDLLRLAAENNYIVMEPTYAAKKCAEETAKRLGYNNVRIVTAQEMRGTKGNFLVDELSWFLEQIGVVGYSETI